MTNTILDGAIVLVHNLQHEEDYRMSLQTHVEALNTKHAEIDDIIAREEIRPYPDRIRLMDLKKQKLRLKEELNRLSAETHH